jgi:hypothetical protein
MVKAEEREAARQMRGEGIATRNIAEKLKVSVSSINTWTQDMPALAPPAAEPSDSVRSQFASRITTSRYRYHHTKSKGDAAEAMTLAAFVNSGVMVSQPFSENSPYDSSLMTERDWLRSKSSTPS